MAMSSGQILFLLQLIVLIDYMCVGAMRTILPYYAKHLGAGGGHVGALETVYGFGQISGAIILGSFSDSHGRKAVLLLSFAGAALGYFIASLAVSQASVQLLLLSRLPVGLAKQTVTASRAVVSDLTAPDVSRSEALARLFAGCSLGYAIGPYLGGRLAEYAGNSSPLPALVCTSIFVLLMPAAAVLLPETSRIDVLAPAPCAAEAAPPEQGTCAAPACAQSSWRASSWLLLTGCTLVEGSLVAFSSTSLALLAQSIGWSPATLGLYNSSWGIGSGCLSLLVWPWLLSSGWLSDIAALRLGMGSLGLANALLAVDGSAAMLWYTLPLGTIAVGMVTALLD